MFSPLELEILHLGPEIRILREISSLEPAPKVWNPKSWSEKEDVICLISCFSPFMGLLLRGLQGHWFVEMIFG